MKSLSAITVMHLGRFLSGACLVGLLCNLPAYAAAPGEPVAVTQALPAASKANKVLLSVTTAQGKQTFTLAQLEALGMYRVSTRTFWPDDDGTYEGPRLADILKEAGLSEAGHLRISALDGFSQVIAREDWQRWPILLATRKAGKALSTRNKGPLRIIYPRDMDKTLQGEVYRLRWVWMVNKMEAVQP